MSPPKCDHGVLIANPCRRCFEGERNTFRAQLSALQARLEEVEKENERVRLDLKKWANSIPGVSMGDTHGLDYITVINAKTTQHAERLAGVVEKLPKTADGVPIALGDTVWIPPETGTASPPEALTVTEISVAGIHGRFVSEVEGGCDESECYSTREAAENAMEPNEPPGWEGGFADNH